MLKFYCKKKRVFDFEAIFWNVYIFSGIRCIHLMENFTPPVSCAVIGFVSGKLLKIIKKYVSGKFVSEKIIKIF